MGPGLSGMFCDRVLRAGLERMELFMTDQRKRKGMLLLGVQMILAASSLAQTVSMPEPPQVRGQNHVVSLTLDAVNEDGRDTTPTPPSGSTISPARAA